MIYCPKGAEFYSLGRRALGSDNPEKSSEGATFSLLSDIVNAAPTEPDIWFLVLGLGAPRAIALRSPLRGSLGGSLCIL